jgi:hypothetical protein
MDQHVKIWSLQGEAAGSGGWEGLVPLIRGLLIRGLLIRGLLTALGPRRRGVQISQDAGLA